MKLLLIINSLTADTSHLKESLDAGLTSAVFGLEVSLLFQGEGVLYLAPETDINQQSLKDLAIYGIENIYVDEQALSQHQLTATHLAISAMPLDNQAMGTLLTAQDTVLHF
ncbi:DsrE family protein [Aestuariicella sp. G3-2]|uniref:DsrE family protein n=1 Tax=Pseudomaricurvus albidus TaxID=2842452 RepID=UPI001C0B141F|nr:DsrE family protein [Aestuariicella albida]MBU3070481.1 DsrE family protein [Aestuariicella albida]